VEENEVEAFKNRSSERETGDHYEAQMVEAFVGKPDAPDKGLWYANSFAKYSINGVDKMTWNWSWWAFFGGIWFLLYRKAYAAAGGLFLISLAAAFIPFAGFVIWVLTGGFSSYFVYKVFKIKKLEIEAAYQDESQRVNMMQVLGGYNQWVVIVAIILNLIAFIGIFMLGAGLAAGVADGQY
jgi:Protein of unknown function (DUF2628)